jgi:aminodeoxyfutalosine deaminase
MQSPLPQTDLLSLPKVELHVHVEGSITAKTAAELARLHGDETGATLPFVGGHYPERFHGLGHFIEVYLAVSQLIRTPDVLAMITALFPKAPALG